MSLVEQRAGALHLYAVDVVFYGEETATVYYIFARRVDPKAAAFLRRRPGRLRELLIPLPCAILRRAGEALRPLSRQELEALLAYDADSTAIYEQSEALSVHTADGPDDAEGREDAREESEASTSELPSESEYSDQDMPVEVPVDAGSDAFDEE